VPRTHLPVRVVTANQCGVCGDVYDSQDGRCDCIPKPPGAYAIGSGHWPGVSKLIEEMGEVNQVLGKILGTGGDRSHWDGSDLILRLQEELGDVLAAIAFVQWFNDLDPEAIADRRYQKLALFKEWHKAGNKLPPTQSEE